MGVQGKKQQERQLNILGKETSDNILQRKRALKSRVGNTLTGVSMKDEPKGMAAEKAMGTVCHLPKSLHRIMTHAADEREISAKRFCFETLLIGLEQQGLITPGQHEEALRLKKDYGWKGRRSSDGER